MSLPINYAANREWNKRSQERARESETRSQTPLKRSRPHPRSKKATERQRAYMEVRDPYMKRNPFCECCAALGTQTPATELHHKRGREGAFLTDVTTFLAVCNPCHLFIHSNPIWAREQGFLGSKFRTIEED